MFAGFAWDPQKALSNKRKHGVSFEEASTVFNDPLAITFPDPDHSDSEDREIILGQSAKKRTLLVVHVERGPLVRIISARLADRKERKSYEEGEPRQDR